MEAPSTGTAAYEWPPVDPAIEQDASAIVDAALGDPSTMDASASTSLVEHLAADSLTDAHRAILDFERRWWRQAGAKEQAIRDTFSMTPTRYYQTLNAVIDLPGAVSYDAALVNRLQRLRTSAVRGRRLT